ncbi:MAG: signal peptidase I [Firmicutes bacterium]|nr:signal peptidase I [Bacillota bacterium]
MIRSILTGLAAILLGVMIFTPSGPAHVISGSMEPEIRTGSTIFIVPAGKIDVGEIIVFHPVGTKHEMIVHRVVEETPEGYITRGDAVSQTDQELGEPPVTDERVAGKVLTIQGSVIQISYSKFINLALGLCLALGFYWTSTATKIVRKKRLRFKHVQQYVLVFCTMIVLFSMILGSGAESVTFLASENPGTRPDHIKVGETGNVDFQVKNRSPLPVLVYVEGPLNRGSGIIRPFSESVTDVGIPARHDPGWYEVIIKKYTYPVVLPPVLINTLYSISPFLAMAAVLAAVVCLLNLILRVIEPWIPLSLLLGGKALRRNYRRLKRSFML